MKLAKSAILLNLKYLVLNVLACVQTPPSPQKNRG